MDAVTAQLMKVAFSFLRNFGILSGASGILGIMSTGVASLGMDTTSVSFHHPTPSMATSMATPPALTDLPK